MLSNIKIFWKKEGKIFNYDGQAWKTVQVPAQARGYALFDLFFPSPDNGWAVGGNSHILHFDGSKWEKYKCFLKGKWKNKELIAVPSFNPLLEGIDVLKEKLLSPFLDKISSFEVFIINKGEVFKFGKVKDILK